MIKIISIIIVLVLTSYKVYSLEINRESYSMSIGLALNNSWNKNNFKQLSEIKNCCPSIFNESFSKNILGEVGFRKFLNNNFAYFVNLGFVNYNDNFESIEYKITVDGRSKIKHSMDLNMFNLQNRIGLSNRFNKMGIAYGIINEFTISKKYNQFEELLEPLGATFENDQKKRNVYVGKVATYLNNYNYGLFGQIWYELYFDDSKIESVSTYLEFNTILDYYQGNKEFKKYNIIIGIQIRWIKWKDYDTPLNPIN